MITETFIVSFDIPKNGDIPTMTVFQRNPMRLIKVVRGKEAEMTYAIMLKKTDVEAASKWPAIHAEMYNVYGNLLSDVNKKGE